MYKYSREAHTLLSTSLFLLGVILPRCFPDVGTGLLHACFHTEQGVLPFTQQWAHKWGPFWLPPTQSAQLASCLVQSLHLCKMGKNGGNSYTVYVAVWNCSKEQIDPELLWRQRAHADRVNLKIPKGII